MRFPLALIVFALASVPSTFAQEPSLGDVARASRAQQARSPKPALVFSNEDQGPQEIKDTDDPLDVYQRGSAEFLRDTSHRCYEQSSGNSGPGWKKSATYEVAAADRMHLVAQDGSSVGESLLVGDSYYAKADGGSWHKLTSDQEIALGRMTFPGALIPQELAFGFHAGDLKSLGKQSAAGVPTILYQYSVHSTDFDRTVSYWLGQQDSLPYRIEMKTEERSWGSAPVVWQESISCSYNVSLQIEPPTALTSIPK